MADAKKVDIKKPEGWNLDPIEFLIIILFLAAFLGGAIPMVIEYFTSGEASFYGIKLSSIYRFFLNIIPFLKFFAFLLIGAFAIGTFIFNKLTDSIWENLKNTLNPEVVKPASGDPSAGGDAFVDNRNLDRWKKILAHLESTNSSEWRLAIIEADIMLEDLLDTMNLPGDTMGDKLKAVERSDFTTVDLAWDGHKVRNRIAHDGSNFLLNQREARRVISLYESVFKEFYLI